MMRQNSGGCMDYIEHIRELRKKILQSLVAVVLIFLTLIYFANDIYHLLALPLLKQLPQASQVIATEIASPLFVPLKLTFIVALMIAIPVVLYHIWTFIAPGLYQKESRVVSLLLISSWCLFYAGIAFCYFIVLPLMFNFFQMVAPVSITIMPDINHYLNFTMKMFLSFGLAFEVPVAVVVLIWMNIFSYQQVASKRRHVIVMAFIIGMLLTPPDVVSQILLAIPIWLLFEVGLLIAKTWLTHSTALTDKNQHGGGQQTS